MDEAGGQLEDGDFAFLLREFGDEVGVIAEDDLVRIALHLGNGEEAADAGHAVDVGDIDGFFAGEMIFPEGAECGVGFFAGRHVVADEQKVGFSGLKGEGCAMLICGGERLDGLAGRVRLRAR